MSSATTINLDSAAARLRGSLHSAHHTNCRCDHVASSPKHGYACADRPPRRQELVAFRKVAHHAEEIITFVIAALMVHKTF